MKRFNYKRLPLVAALLLVAGACNDNSDVMAPFDDAPAFAKGGGGKPPKAEPTTQIAFAIEGANGGIHVTNPDGTGYAAVPNTEGGTQPAWSPDRRKFAYAIPSGPQAGIYVIGANGRQQTRLYAGAAGAPAWHPDGSRIAFHATLNNSKQILVIGANGGGLVQATAVGTRNEDPAWSPAGDRLAFFSNRYGQTGIWVMAVNTGARQRIASCSQCGAPAWSPVGGDERIAFGQWGSGSLNFTQVGIVPATGGIVQNVFHEMSPYAVTVRPSWSPDATRLVVSTNVSGSNRELLVGSIADPLDRIVITSTPGAEVAPAWAW